MIVHVLVKSTINWKSIREEPAYTDSIISFAETHLNIHLDRSSVDGRRQTCLISRRKSSQTIKEPRAMERPAAPGRTSPCSDQMKRPGLITTAATLSRRRLCLRDDKLGHRHDFWRLRDFATSTRTTNGAMATDFTSPYGEKRPGACFECGIAAGQKAWMDRDLSSS